MARGLLPVQTWSAHWLAHPQFARAVGDFLEREGAGIETTSTSSTSAARSRTPPTRLSARRLRPDGSRALRAA